MAITALSVSKANVLVDIEISLVDLYPEALLWKPHFLLDGTVVYCFTCTDLVDLELSDDLFCRFFLIEQDMVKR